jgi:ankyrin repeat protein
LRWASGNGHAEVVKLLLDAGADVHADNDWALQLASYNGHAEVVKLLKQYGAKHKSVNESIKHLKPRSEEEMGLDDLKKIADDDLFNIFIDAGGIEDFTSLDVKLLKELKRRNSPNLDSIRKSRWYKKHIDKIAQLLNEL